MILASMMSNTFALSKLVAGVFMACGRINYNTGDKGL
jgi:hypothetical protein